jgi:hypothetical protein
VKVGGPTHSNLWQLSSAGHLCDSRESQVQLSRRALTLLLSPFLS